MSTAHNFIDLKGQRFGRLTVLERAEDHIEPNGNKVTMWTCKCDCGNITIVNSYSLRKGVTKSCGCLNHDSKIKRNNKFVDLTGKEFGRLTVLHEEGYVYYNNRTKKKQWRCRCECGREIVVSGSNLRKGITQSCGKCKHENRYEFFDDYIIGYTSKDESFIIDRDDFEKISPYHWHYRDRLDQNKSHEWVEAVIDQKYVMLHRFVMDAKDGEIIDHINHDKTDNRKTNLRKVTAVQSSINRTVRRDNKSGCPGVFQRNDTTMRKWRAFITVDKKLIRLGSFFTKEEAIAARKAAEHKYFGEYAYDASVASVPRIEINPAS